MAHLVVDVLQELSHKYEARVKVGSDDFDETIRAYVPSLASRKILNYAISLAVDKIRMSSVLQSAYGIPSAQTQRSIRVLIRGLRESNKLDLQDWVLRLKGLATDESETLSRARELASVLSRWTTATSKDSDCLVEHRNFLAYVTAVIDHRLRRAFVVEAAVGVPCLRILRYAEVLVLVVQELRKLELEEAKLRAKALGIEFPDTLARALEYGDVERVSKVLDSKTHSKS